MKDEREPLDPMEEFINSVGSDDDICKTCDGTGEYPEGHLCKDCGGKGHL